MLVDRVSPSLLLATHHGQSLGHTPVDALLEFGRGGIGEGHRQDLLDGDLQPGGNPGLRRFG